MPVDSRIEAAAAELLASPHGRKGAIVAALAAQLGVSVPTAYRRLNQVVASLRPRKRRSDAGQLTVTRDEALHIAALTEETRRLTGTGTLPLEEVVGMARANGLINAGRVDTSTGEFTPVGVSAVRRALRQYHVHPSQLNAPTPAAALSSPHPNWCWQIDASVSRQFYLADDGAHVMPKAEFYRGKPQNFERITDRRLWRYVVTDHASGHFDLFYVQGAESAINLLASLIHAMTQQPGRAMHGVPHILMTDPGSAMTAAATRNFCAALGIRLQINEVGNARAKGQVENTHFIVERHFEAGLKLRAPVTSLEQINTLAQQWAYAYCATRVHSRTGVTRRDGWLRITPDQLKEAPPVEVLRTLANSEPKACTVRDCRIKFRGRRWDVSGIDGLINGQKVDVIRNPFDGDASVRIVRTGDDGQVVHMLAPRIETDSFGFVAGAAQIGTEFKAPRETPADAARKEIERLAMDVRTDAEALAARKSKRLAYGGKLDPHKHLLQSGVTPHLPRAGKPATVDAPATQAAPAYVEPVAIRPEFPPLNHVDAARSLKPLVERAGGTWSAELYQRTVQRWPDGLPLEQVEAWAAELATGTRLRVVGGAA
ncbi:transposase [bacterium]|nr:MAG: transposase [bacterium]